MNFENGMNSVPRQKYLETVGAPKDAYKLGASSLNAFMNGTQSNAKTSVEMTMNANARLIMTYQRRG
jgi:hypothetical protein